MIRKPEAKPGKREHLRAVRKRQSLLWNIILLGGAGLSVLAIAAYVIATGRPGPLPGEQVIPDEGAAHIRTTDNVTPQYAHYPPSSGTHYGDAVAPWGVYTKDNPVPEGVFVHNLEHGGVVFLYRCPDACPELEQQLGELYKKAPPDSTFNEVKIVITPYAKDLPTTIVALAWDHQLNLDQFDETLLLRWYKRFVNRGPELAR